MKIIDANGPLIASEPDWDYMLGVGEALKNEECFQKFLLLPIA